MVGWYHCPSGQEFEQTQGDSEKQKNMHVVIHVVTESDVT